MLIEKYNFFLMVSPRFIASKWILALGIHDKKLFSDISKALNSSFVKFDIIYKKTINKIKSWI